MNALTGKTVLLGVSGSIAAYKACDLARELVKAGARVEAILTRAAAELVRPLTFASLTGNPVGLEMFEEGGTFRHLDASRRCDLALVAPATANLVAKLALGLADDLLTTALLAVTAPVVVAPAMNTRMYNHPAVQANLERLRSFGHRIVSPEEGELACGEEGIGRLADVPRILGVVREVLASPHVPPRVS